MMRLSSSRSLWMEHEQVTSLVFTAPAVGHLEAPITVLSLQVYTPVGTVAISTFWESHCLLQSLVQLLTKLITLTTDVKPLTLP